MLRSDDILDLYHRGEFAAPRNPFAPIRWDEKAEDAMNRTKVALVCELLPSLAFAFSHTHRHPAGEISKEVGAAVVILLIAVGFYLQHLRYVRKHESYWQQAPGRVVRF